MPCVRWCVPRVRTDGHDGASCHFSKLNGFDTCPYLEVSSHVTPTLFPRKTTTISAFISECPCSSLLKPHVFFIVSAPVWSFKAPKPLVFWESEVWTLGTMSENLPAFLLICLRRQRCSVRSRTVVMKVGMCFHRAFVTKWTSQPVCLSSGIYGCHSGQETKQCASLSIPEDSRCSLPAGDTLLASFCRDVTQSSHYYFISYFTAFHRTVIWQ
jgi:hypothetical protein